MGDHDDFFDDYIRFEMLNESSGGGSGSLPSGGAIFGIVVAICLGILLLAVVLGVEISGTVVEFFLQIIGTVGFFVFLGFVFKKR